jgi:hypothetical protein
MFTAFRRWRDRTFGRPVEGDDRRAGQNVDALSAAASGSQHTVGGADGGAQAHGNIPPNYVPPVDEGRPRH